MNTNGYPSTSNSYSLYHRKCGVSFERVDKDIENYLMAIAEKTELQNLVSADWLNGRFVAYFANEQAASQFIDEGLWIQDQHVTAEPLATKIVLSNVNPDLPTSLIIDHLQKYGEVVNSSLKTIPVAFTGLSHILSYRRELYMYLNNSTVPSEIKVQYHNAVHTFYVDVLKETSSSAAPSSSNSVKHSKIRNGILIRLLNELKNISNIDRIRSIIKNYTTDNELLARSLIAFKKKIPEINFSASERHNFLKRVNRLVEILKTLK